MFPMEFFWLVTGILTVVFTVYAGYINDWDLIEFFKGTFVMFFGAAMISFVITMVTTFFVREKFDVITDTRIVETRELTALHDNRDVSGNGSMLFFVGSMQINQDPYYYFMIDTEFGMQMQKEPADRIFIKEGDYEPKYTRQVTYMWYAPKHKDSWFYTDEVNEVYGTEIKTLYVPSGTVKRDFNIDLQ